MWPGAIAFTRTPCGPHSTASVLVICTTAPLLAWYPTLPGNPTRPPTEAMLIIEPEPCAHHVRADELGDRERAGQVRGEHPIPEVVGVVDGRRATADAGAVDASVDATEHAERTIDDTSDVGPVTQIEPEPHVPCRRNANPTRLVPR